VKGRRHAGRKAALLLIVVLGLLTADSGIRIVTTEYELGFAALPADLDGVRIVQLSDLHGAVFGKDNTRLVSRVAAARPDLIALTGDLADRDTELSDIDTLLAALTQIAPVYYVSGNHEWSAGLPDVLTPLFDRYGVTYLRNEAVLFSVGDASLLLIGVEDPNGYRDQPTPEAVAAAAQTAHPDCFTVLLGHRNDFLTKYPALPVQLVLCGHAHGGIVRLPGIGGLLGTGGTFFPDYSAGIFPGKHYTMVVSRGLGSSVPVPRFRNNPEIVAVTLRKS